jgi:hypothetical protein
VRVSDSLMPVGILAIATTPGILRFVSQLDLGFHPEPDAISGRLSGKLPILVGREPDGIRRADVRCFDMEFSLHGCGT